MVKKDSQPSKVKSKKEDSEKSSQSSGVKLKKEKSKVTSKKDLKKPVKKKTEEKKAVAKKEIAIVSDEKEKKGVVSSEGEYIEAVGRRKTSVAIVRLFTKGKKEFIINDKVYSDYLSTLELQESCVAPLKKMKCFDNFRVTVKVRGGGINSQMEAIRHGISRALVVFNSDFKKRLRRVGYLTRDPRQRERKKPGLKRARRAPQWKKR